MITNVYNHNIINNNDYYIEKLDITNNLNWDKKYFDVTYIETDVSYNDTKMLFNFNINIASRNKLPLGTMKMNISMPGLEIKNINIYDSYKVPNTNIYHYPSWICKIFTASIEIDISDNEYFNREIMNENIKINYLFDIDIDTFSKNEIKYTHESVSLFFNEVRTKNLEASFDYSNMIVVSKTEQYMLPIKNHFNTNGTQQKQYSNLNFILPNKFINNRFYNLFNINSDFNIFNINGYELEFHYYFKNNLEKLYFSQFESDLVNYSYDFNLEKNFIYNYSSNKFEETTSEIGIIFPFKTWGFYQIKFSINISGKRYIVYIKNNFNANESSWIKFKKEEEVFNDYEKI